MRKVVYGVAGLARRTKRLANLMFAMLAVLACQTGHKPASSSRLATRATISCQKVDKPSKPDRYVLATNDGKRDLYLQVPCAIPWDETWTQRQEPPEGNFCDPTAVKNILHWYDGKSPYYETLGRQLRTNAWGYDLVITAFCAAHCPLDPVACGAACYAAGAKADPGTLPNDMIAVLRNSTPTGYKLITSFESEATNELLALLRSGNPVIVLESRSSTNMHWTVVNGVGIAQDGTMQLRFANSDDRPLAEFVEDWSLKKLEPVAKDFVVGQLGIKPYTMIAYQRDATFVAIDRMLPGGDWTNVYQNALAPGWEQVVPYAVGGKQYFLWIRKDGAVDVDLVSSDGATVANVSRNQLASRGSDWRATSYSTPTGTFVAWMRQTGEIRVDSVDPASGKLGSTFVQEFRLEDRPPTLAWSELIAYRGDTSPFVLVKRKDGEVRVYAIAEDGRFGALVARHMVSAQQKPFTYQAGGSSFVLWLDSESGAVKVD